MFFGLFISQSYSANQYNYDKASKKFTIIADENYTVDDIKKVFPSTLEFTSLSIQGKCNNIPLHAFEGASELTTVEITAPITHIFGYAFANCAKLTTFTVPETLEYIGYYCFSQDIALETFYWRNHLMTINSNAFENCTSLKSFKQVDGDTTKSVEGVEKKFGDLVFVYCSKLTECQLPSDIKTLGKQVFAETPSLKSLDLPADYKEVDDYSFQGCAIENVNLVNVEVVSFFAFAGSLIKTVTFSNKLQQICVSAFDGCRYLTTVNGLDSNENFVIQNAAFEGCVSLTSMKIPTGMTEIPDYVFSVCTAMTSVNLHNGIKKIGKCSFFNTGITSIHIGPLVEEIGEAAFGSMKELKEISVDSSNKYFAYDETGRFLCNKDKTLIYIYPQENAAKQLKIQNTFTTILPYAFAYAQNLESISLPDELVLIGGNSFEGCSKLTSVVFPKKATTIFMSVFANCKALIDIDISSVETINDDAFRNCVSLKNIKFGPSLQTISKQAFLGCSVLPSLDFSNCQNLTYLGESAFKFCKGLTKVVLPPKLKVVPNECFFYCTTLAEIVFDDHLQEIWQNAFGYTQALSTVTFPSQLKVIQQRAFSHSGLKTVTVPAMVNTLTRNSFSYCDKLESFEVFGDILKIERSVFSNSNNLKTIKFGGFIDAVDQLAFNATKGLKNITYCGLSTVGGEALKNHEPHGIQINVAVALDYQGTTFMGIPATKEPSACPPRRTPEPTPKPTKEPLPSKKVIIIAAVVVVSALILTAVIVIFVVKCCMKKNGWIKKETLTESLLTQSI